MYNPYFSMKYFTYITRNLFTKINAFLQYLSTPIHFLKNYNDSQLLLKYDRDDRHNFSPLLLLIIGCPYFVSPAHEIKITAVHNSNLQYYHSDYPLHFLTIFFFLVYISQWVFILIHSYIWHFLHLPEIQLFTFYIYVLISRIFTAFPTILYRFTWFTSYCTI
jgi:hypothetical protein